MADIKVYVIAKSGRDAWYLKAKRGNAFIGERSARTRNRRDADRAAALWQRELEDADNPRKAKVIAWDEFVDRYVDSRIKSKAKATVVKDITAFKHFARVVGPIPPADITTEHVDTFKVRLLDEGLRPTTVDSHLRQLRAAFRWAAKSGRRLMSRAPEVELHNQDDAKSRPITTEEFERMLAVVPDVVGADRAESWRLTLRGMWETGLRRSEVVRLHWTDHRHIRVDLDREHPAIEFAPNTQKNKKHAVVPLTPQAVELLRSLPDREGFVFSPEPLGNTNRLCGEQVGRIVARIGKAARIVVKPAANAEDEPVYAGCHSLRRGFCDRWSRLVMPATLMVLARHAALATTLTYYVNREADAVAKAVADALHNRDAVGSPVGTAAIGTPSGSP